MSTRSVLSGVLLIALLSISSLSGAQTTAPNLTTPAPSARKWNHIPPEKPAYAAKKKAAPAPRRDLSGIWDALAEGGIQAKGANAHPALIAGHPQDDIGGQADEANTLYPIPYTDAGLAALKANKPSVGVRSLGPALSND